MLIEILVISLFVGVKCGDQQPKFQVLTPDELMVEVPNYDNLKLVTFRIGVQRKDNNFEDLERGENIINNNRIFIYDDRLDLKKGDIVNYLLAFKDKDGYQAQTGKYVFDGVYYKKSSGRRLRFRRGFPDFDVDDAEEFNPTDTRFGGHGRNPFQPPPHHHFERPWHRRHHHFRPGSVDCNDHRHDICHNQKPERQDQSTSTTEIPQIDVRFTN